MQQMPNSSSQTGSGFHYEQAQGVFTRGVGNEKSPPPLQEKASNSAPAPTASRNTFYPISFPTLSDVPRASPIVRALSLSNPEQHRCQQVDPMHELTGLNTRQRLRPPGGAGRVLQGTVTQEAGSC